MTSFSSRWRRVASVVVLTLCVAQLTFSQIRPKRMMRVDLTGEAEASIVAIVTVDGVTTNVTKELPAEFEFHAEDRVAAMEREVKKLKRNLMMLGLAVIMTTVVAIIGVAN